MLDSKASGDATYPVRLFRELLVISVKMSLNSTPGETLQEIRYKVKHTTFSRNTTNLSIDEKAGFIFTRQYGGHFPYGQIF